MNILSWLKRRIEIWKFKHGVGELWRQFSQLTQQTERSAFVMEHFGREGLELLRTYSSGGVVKADDWNRLISGEISPIDRVRETVTEQAERIKSIILAGSLYGKPVRPDDLGTLIVGAYWLGRHEESSERNHENEELG